jgi:plastocyanin
VGVVGIVRDSGDQGTEQRVARTRAGWEPRTLTVERGEVVVFANESDEDVWPASDVHPTHQLYPGFDAKRGVSPGRSWSFTFERPGRWTYHDHLSPETKATIVVR